MIEMPITTIKRRAEIAGEHASKRTPIRVQVERDNLVRASTLVPALIPARETCSAWALRAARGSESNDELRLFLELQLKHEAS
jgi:hypothetical protein